MRVFCPHKIVAPVVRWSHDHVMFGQRDERVFENCTRQMWAVAVEGNDASLTTFCEVGKHRSEAGGKTFTFLRNYAHIFACEPRQFVYVRVRAHHGIFHTPQGPSQRQRIVEKTAIESRDNLRRKAGRKASLDRAWSW